MRLWTSRREGGKSELCAICCVRSKIFNIRRPHYLADFFNYYRPSSRVSTHSSALRWVACAGTYIPSLQSHMTRPAAIPLCISSLLQLLDEAQMISSIDEVEEDALLLEINNWWDTLATTVQQEGFGPDALLDGGVAGLLSSIK